MKGRAIHVGVKTLVPKSEKLAKPPMEGLVIVLGSHWDMVAEFVLFNVYPVDE